MSENSVQLMKGCRISVLDFLWGDSTVLVDSLFLNLIEAGDDGGKDIFGVVFLEIFVATGSWFSKELRFEVWLTGLKRGLWFCVANSLRWSFWHEDNISIDD